MKRVGLGVLVAVVMLATVVSVAQAAAPRIVIVSGKSLDRQVVISDWTRSPRLSKGS